MHSIVHAWGNSEHELMLTSCTSTLFCVEWSCIKYCFWRNKTSNMLCTSSYQLNMPNNFHDRQRNDGAHWKERVPFITATGHSGSWGKHRYIYKYSARVNGDTDNTLPLWLNQKQKCGVSTDYSYSWIHWTVQPGRWGLLKWHRLLTFRHTIPPLHWQDLVDAWLQSCTK